MQDLNKFSKSGEKYLLRKALFSLILIFEKETLTSILVMILN